MSRSRRTEMKKEKMSRPHRYHQQCKARAQAERISASTGKPAAVLCCGADTYEARDLRRAERAVAAYAEFRIVETVEVTA